MVAAEHRKRGDYRLTHSFEKSDFVTALDVFLTADHGGLPAGSELQIGYAEANAQASEAAPLPTPPRVGFPLYEPGRGFTGSLSAAVVSPAPSPRRQ